MTPNTLRTWPSRTDLDLWVRRGCALVVAGVAAYASYEHQREFAVRGGADPTGAALWPLSVDGLLVLATVGLLKIRPQTSRHTELWCGCPSCWASPCRWRPNIAAAPALAWQPVLVAGWPPVALLLAVELLAHRPLPEEHTETEPVASLTSRDSESETATGVAEVSQTSELPSEPTAEEVMWGHFLPEQAPPSTGCARSIATNPGTTNCAPKPSNTAARPCTPTQRTIQGCSGKPARLGCG
jgi:Protein of unknown function (DUF2637)